MSQSLEQAAWELLRLKDLDARVSAIRGKGFMRSPADDAELRAIGTEYANMDPAWDALRAALTTAGEQKDLRELVVRCGSAIENVRLRGLEKDHYALVAADKEIMEAAQRIRDAAAHESAEASTEGRPAGSDPSREPPSEPGCPDCGGHNTMVMNGTCIRHGPLEPESSAALPPALELQGEPWFIAYKQWEHFYYEGRPAPAGSATAYQAGYWRATYDPIQVERTQDAPAADARLPRDALEDAATMLEEEAAALFASHSVDGAWALNEEGAHEAMQEWRRRMNAAHSLRRRAASAPLVQRVDERVPRETLERLLREAWPIIDAAGAGWLRAGWPNYLKGDAAPAEGRE